jgi:uncharacterized membrane protein
MLQGCRILELCVLSVSEQDRKFWFELTGRWQILATLFLRAYALWQGNRTVGVILAILALAVGVTLVSIVHFQLITSHIRISLALVSPSTYS